MKPRPTGKKDLEAADRVQRKAATSTRTIFVKNNELSREGFRSFEEATEARQTLGDDSDTQRVRIRFRNRTGLWDVLVKSAREVPIPPAIGE